MDLRFWRRGKPPAYAPTTKAVVCPPTRRQGPFTWSLEQIRYARDCQLRGEFETPARMAAAMRTDDALFTAYITRVSTQQAIRLDWVAADSARGKAAARRAENTIHVPQHVRESILGTLANHGLAIGYVRSSTRDSTSGPTVDLALEEWPLEHVRADYASNTIQTRTEEHGTITISHGDGKWIVFRKFGVEPWTQDACVLPGALLWAAHGNAVSDWAGASSAHGRPQVLGQLPEGFALAKEDGSLTPEADAYLSTLDDVINGGVGAGLAPAGSSTDYLANGSTAWQVFEQLVLNREKAAMRIYLGTDAILGAQGGAPGVDIDALLNVASTRVQGDLEALERGFYEGMIVPWGEIYGVRPSELPRLKYAIPDVDGRKRAQQEADSIQQLRDSVEGLKTAGLVVDQNVVDTLKHVLMVTVDCELAAEDQKSTPIDLAPTDVAKVVTAREARAAQGLPPFGDERDDLTISQMEAAATAQAAPTTPVEGEGERPEDAPTNDTAPTE